MTPKIKTVKSHGGRGGYRPGAGRKKELEGGRGIELYLDDPTIAFYSDLGGGNASLGARRAKDLLLESLSWTKGKKEKYKGKTNGRK